MTERVLTFGASANLVGILSEPEPGSSIAGSPAVLFWNVGINHRVGLYRMYVDLARALAAAGYMSLRFDISGLGDSEVSRDDARPEHERAAADVRAAMQVLRTRRPVEQFVLVGFCSSVDAAHVLAIDDPDVVGAVFIEGYTFTTPGARLRWPLRLLNADRWERLLRRRASWLFGEAPLEIPREQVYKREYPSAKKFRDDVARMVERGVRLLFLYAGGDTPYEHRAQLFEVLRSSKLESRVELDYYPAADHTFFLVEDRVRAMNRIVRFIAERFPGVGIASRSAPAQETLTQTAAGQDPALGAAVRTGTGDS
jgi:dienelactone hydrolase